MANNVFCNDDDDEKQLFTKKTNGSIRKHSNFYVFFCGLKKERIILNQLIFISLQKFERN